MRPHELIEDKKIFKDHFLKTRKCITSEQFEKAASEFSSEQRKSIAESYRKLRQHGFVPVGIDSRGAIVWGGNNLKSNPYMEIYDNPLKRSDIERVKKKGLKFKPFKDMPTLTQDEGAAGEYATRCKGRRGS